MKKYTLFLLISLCGCVKTVPQSICPSLIPYSAEQQRGVSEELKNHSDLVYIPLFLQGYAQMRDGLRSLSAPKTDAGLRRGRN